MYAYIYKTKCYTITSIPFYDCNKIFISLTTIVDNILLMYSLCLPNWVYTKLCWMQSESVHFILYICICVIAADHTYV